MDYTVFRAWPGDAPLAVNVILMGMETSAGFVLCGGQSRRMGRDKALLPMGGKVLIEHMAQLVESAAGSATLVGAPDRYRDLGYPVLADQRAGAGPLAGLVALLRHSKADLNLVVPCDMPGLGMPGLGGGFVLKMMEEARAHPECDAVVPTTTSGTGPLSAVYRRSALATFEEDLAAGQLRVRAAVMRLKIRKIWVEPVVLQNVNTPDEWVRFVEA